MCLSLVYFDFCISVTWYSLVAIATVLSQLLFTGLCLSQDLTLTMHFILQGGRPQILKAKHTAHTQQICFERIDGWTRLHEVSTSARIFPSEPLLLPHSTKNFFLLTFTLIGNNQTWLHHEHPGGGRVEYVSSESHMTVGSLTPQGKGSLSSTSGPLSPILWSLGSF